MFCFATSSLFLLVNVSSIINFCIFFGFFFCCYKNNIKKAKSTRVLVLISTNVYDRVIWSTLYSNHSSWNRKKNHIFLVSFNSSFTEIDQRLNRISNWNSRLSRFFRVENNVVMMMRDNMCQRITFTHIQYRNEMSRYRIIFWVSSAVVTLDFCHFIVHRSSPFFFSYHHFLC
jgi:hypothetical protein